MTLSLPLNLPRETELLMLEHISEFYMNYLTFWNNVRDYINVDETQSTHYFGSFI